MSCGANAPSARMQSQTAFKFSVTAWSIADSSPVRNPPSTLVDLTAADASVVEQCVELPLVFDRGTDECIPVGRAGDIGPNGDRIGPGGANRLDFLSRPAADRELTTVRTPLLGGQDGGCPTDATGGP